MMSSNAPNIPVEVALHRYFIWANKMRTDFDNLLAEEKNTKSPEDKFLIEQNLNIYMSYWYAGLYVVIEGWKALKLQDADISNLLKKEDYIDLLRKYRNGVFHYQQDYFSSKFTDVWSQKQDFITWIRELNSLFGRYFLQWHAKYKKK